jgi:hypothetical protein
MSDTSQGPGWWIASDGKRYPPEQATQVAVQVAPEATAVAGPATAPGGYSVPPGPGYYQATDGNWYPQQPGMAPQKEKKPVYKRVWFWLLMAALAFIVLIIALIAAAGTAINDANTKVHTVIYTVSGSGSATITYDAVDNGHSGETQNSDVALPWTKTIKGSGLFNAYTVTATLGDAGGTATCTLTVDGKQVSSNTATGSFASATCTGSAS